jgi:photosystem II stability/assembly factor-like uncharacterized protein
MKLLFTILSFTLLSSAANSQWVLQTSGSGFDLFSASFPSASTGFACGYGNHLIKTTDGGANWIDISFPSTASNLNTIIFVNENTGWLCSTDTLLYTTNSGLSWTPRITPINGRELFFVNVSTGWLNTGQSILRTTDGGANWITISFASDGEIFFVNGTTGWTSYSSGGSATIFKTTNGGVNWTAQFNTTNFHYIYSFYFINENTGWATGYRETVLKTTNGGTNWVFQRDISGGSGFYSAYFINANTGWVVGDQSVLGSNALSTTNGGSSWSPSNVSGGGRFTKIQFVNSATGWMVGQYNTVYKTTNNGGLTSVTKNNNQLPDKYALYQNYPNPFNPETNIIFQTSESGDVKLTIFDILGRKVSTLVNEHLSPGTYKAVWDASSFPSGIYYYSLETNGYYETRKMILMK